MPNGTASVMPLHGHDAPYWELWLRWNTYRRWKRRVSPQKRADYNLRTALYRMAPAAIAVDCGANVGEVSAILAKYSDRVIAFEPDPVALTALRKRLSDNPKVTIIPKAVGGSARVEHLFQTDNARQGDLDDTICTSIFHFDHLSDEATTEVEVIDLVEFMRGLDAPIGLLKIDIEGGEAEVLEALLDSGFHKRIGCILVETHDRFSPALATRLDAIRARIKRERITNIDLTWI
jgi:FkbM family methyltransferase